jgi:iron complex outermembrane receptor protein
VTVSRNVFDKWRSKGDQTRLHVEGKLRQELPRGSVSLNAYYNDRDDHDFLDVTVQDFEASGRDLDLSEEYVVLTDKAAQADANALFWDAWSNRREDLLLGVTLDVRPSDRVGLKMVPYLQNQDGVGTWLPDYRPDAAASDPLATEARDQTRNTWRETQYFLNRFGTTGSVSVDLGGASTVTAGVWAEHYERIAKRVWFDLPDQDSYDVETIRDQVTPYWTQFDRNYRIDTYLGYVKAQTRPVPALQLSAGVRAQGYSIDFFDDLEADLGSFDDRAPFLPQVGFVLDAGREHQVFGSVSRNFSQVPDDAVRQSATVDGEKSTNVDLGYRFLRPGRSTSIAGFWVRYTDKIESIQLGPYDRYANESALQNVGGIDAVGLEVTGDYALAGGFGLFGSLSLTRSRYSGDVADASEPGGVLRIDGNDAVFTPRVQAYGELSYRTGDLTLAVNGKYVGSRKASLAGPTDGDPADQEELDPYFLAGFSARWAWQRMSVTLNGTNVTDASYLASTSGIGPGTSRHPGGGTYFPGSPRWLTFGVGVAF